ncbi:MAG: hypothetical protein AB7G21_14890 [Dehalococcoidia bacterium]
MQGLRHRLKARPRHLLPAALGISLLLLVGIAPRVASAQAALPYLAYGVGLRHGQSVEARVAGVPVGHAVADTSGRWKMQIDPGPDVATGDVLEFAVDDVLTDVRVVFQSGRFPAPPGIALAGGAPVASDRPASRPSATPRPTTIAPRPATTATSVTPRPTARPTATPRAKTLCTKDGRPSACAPFTIKPITR